MALKRQELRASKLRPLLHFLLKKRAAINGIKMTTFSYETRQVLSAKYVGNPAMDNGYALIIAYDLGIKLIW